MNRLACFNCPTRNLTEWCVLSDAELDHLEQGRHMREHLPGDVIFHEGDQCIGVYCVSTGLVGIRKSDANGNSILLYLAKGGDTIGYRALLANQEYGASAEALEPSQVCYISSTTVRQLIQENPELGLRYLKRISENLGQAEEKILHTTTLSVRQRFAHLLVILIDKYDCRTSENEADLDLPLSRHDLASMIGTTPESMSRTIKNLERDGIAEFSGRKVKVASLENLIKVFEPDHFI